MSTEHSQYKRSYKVFTNEVEPPFGLARTLSNGELIGKCYHFVDGALNDSEIEEYIKINHVEEKTE